MSVLAKNASMYETERSAALACNVVKRLNKLHSMYHTLLHADHNAGLQPKSILFTDPVTEMSSNCGARVIPHVALETTVQLPSMTRPIEQYAPCLQLLQVCLAPYRSGMSQLISS